jgi:hypothetical protein
VSDVTSGWWQEVLLQSPFFEPVRERLLQLPRTHFPGPDDLNRIADAGLCNAAGVPLHFVAPIAAPAVAKSVSAMEQSYEWRIWREGLVQTRAGNWHDLFNALAWMCFPRSKGLFNRLHVQAMQQSAERPRTRGTLRDVLTLFDEGGMIVLSADAALSQLLRDFAWKPLFLEKRSQVIDLMRFFVFGHALQEKALAPHRGITAKCLMLSVTPDQLGWSMSQWLPWLDAQVCDYFSRPESLSSTRLLAPLPVLGIPGWASENEDPLYYDDSNHFRAGRRVGVSVGAA